MLGRQCMHQIYDHRVGIAVCSCVIGCTPLSFQNIFLISNSAIRKLALRTACTSSLLSYNPPSTLGFYTIFSTYELNVFGLLFEGPLSTSIPPPLMGQKHFLGSCFSHPLFSLGLEVGGEGE